MRLPFFAEVSQDLHVTALSLQPPPTMKNCFLRICLVAFCSAASVSMAHAEEAGLLILLGAGDSETHGLGWKFDGLVGESDGANWMAI